ncbi:MAG: GNAT family N-acetyltransferase [Trueperaceae bacterium]
MAGGEAPEPTVIRALTASDVTDARALRIEALRDSPRAFATSVEEEEARSLEQTAARIEPGPGFVVLGAYDDVGRLVGMVGLRREDHAKERHKATLWGMYVTPGARGRGVARALVQDLLERAAAMQGLRQVNLGVAADNEPARRLYEAFGFETFGLERNALVVDGDDVDELFMVRVIAG